MIGTEAIWDALAKLQQRLNLMPTIERGTVLSNGTSVQLDSESSPLAVPPWVIGTQLRPGQRVLSILWNGYRAVIGGAHQTTGFTPTTNLPSSTPGGNYTRLGGNLIYYEARIDLGATVTVPVPVTISLPFPVASVLYPATVVVMNQGVAYLPTLAFMSGATVNIFPLTGATWPTSTWQNMSLVHLSALYQTT